MRNLDVSDANATLVNSPLHAFSLSLKNKVILMKTLSL